MFTPEQIHRMLTSDPHNFVNYLLEEDDVASVELAEQLDTHDPLKLREHFDVGDFIPFAGHSLGSSFKPARDAIDNILRLQREQLHGGHFSETAAEGGNWFDYDIEPQAIKAMQAYLGFKEPEEFIYTQAGLSDNLRNVLSTFYHPSARDWREGKTKICYLAGEFFSDQSVIQGVIRQAIRNAKDFEIFTDNDKPTVDSQTIPLAPNDDGLYSEDYIIKTVHERADQIRVLHLSDVVFNTGQRLDIPYILGNIRQEIDKNKIIVGLDLAHTVANRPVELEALKVVTYAVGCGYKHACGTAGSPFGLYVNRRANLEHHIPIQGWKAADSSKVFAKINSYDPDIMSTVGARAFRASNPAVITLAPIQTYMKFMSNIGWDKLVAKSECLTSYMHVLLEAKFGSDLQLITPEDPMHRGATLVFRIKGIHKVSIIEDALKQPHALGQFEIDTRPPNNIRITPHYGYTRFSDIQRMVTRLQLVVQHIKDIDARKERDLASLSLFGTVKSTEDDGASAALKLS